jgi:hypothetical protein
LKEKVGKKNFRPLTDSAACGTSCLEAERGGELKRLFLKEKAGKKFQTLGGKPSSLWRGLFFFDSVCYNSDKGGNSHDAAGAIAEMDSGQR